MDALVLSKGPTYVHLGVPEDFDFYQLEQVLTWFHRKFLSEREFDQRSKRYVIIKEYFIASTSDYYYPVSCYQKLFDLLTTEGFPVEERVLSVIEPHPIHLKMNKTFVNRKGKVIKLKDLDHQVPLLEYLIENEEPMRGLELQTGKGKTYMGIKTAVKLGCTTLIIDNNSQIPQWEESVRNFVNLKPDDLYIIQGSESLQKLFDSKLKPAFFIATIQTLRLYLTKSGKFADLKYSFTKFLSVYGIGTRITDEIHLNFHANVMLDLHCRVRHNLYLSATFTQGSKESRRIFNTVYPFSIRVGKETRTVYCRTTRYNFAGNVSNRKVMTCRGYNQARYEGQILYKNEKLLNYYSSVVLLTLYNHYLTIRNPGEKCILFFGTINMIDIVLEKLRYQYPDYAIDKYVAGSKFTVLKCNDIILATPRGCGTGKDIPNLRTVISFVSVAAPTIVEQMFGRLREFSNGVIPEFVHTCDLNIDSQVRHAEENESFYRRNSIEYTVNTIN